MPPIYNIYLNAKVKHLTMPLHFPEYRYAGNNAKKSNSVHHSLQLFIQVSPNHEKITYLKESNGFKPNYKLMNALHISKT